MKPNRREEGQTPLESADTASATECTGLLPNLPASEAAAEDALALYAVTKPKRRRKGEKRNQ